MYRIRLTSGQEQTYRSIQELTAAVQGGEVTGESEIFHQRSDRWLPIESHPHYRMAAEGGTATRVKRLKFTRPSSPASAPGVLPTPTAQKPDQSDLEELNRLLVLLDPLPAPAQRAEPEAAPVKSSPDLSLVRPDPAPAASDDPQPTFGKMLSLDDLELVPEAEAAAEEPAAVAEPVEKTPEPSAGADLGLPVQIQMEEIPVPGEAVMEEDVEELGEEEQEDELGLVSGAAQVPERVLEPVAVAAGSDVEVVVEPWAPAPAPVDEALLPAPRRRFRPMLYVAVAAFLAAAVFAFTSNGDDPNASRVTLASATVPPSAVTSHTTPPATSSAVTIQLEEPASAPAQPAAAAVGFPLPDTSTPAAPVVEEASLLPSAPEVDLTGTSTARVEGGASSSNLTGSGSSLARGYAEAYAALARDFNAQMDRNGLVRLFNQTLLTTEDGLAGARRALDASAASIRQYRTRESAIEKAYADSARALERSGASPADLRDWMTHLSQRESAEAANESSRFLGQVDAVFALLQAQSGRYRIQGSSIQFDNGDAAARYAELQGWITRRLEYWSGQPAGSVPVTVQPILQGIGLTRLPAAK